MVLKMLFNGAKVTATIVSVQGRGKMMIVASSTASAGFDVKVGMGFPECARLSATRMQAFRTLKILGFRSIETFFLIV